MKDRRKAPRGARLPNPVNDAPAEVHNGNFFQSIAAGERVYLAENAQLCQIFLKNLGPGIVALSSSFGPQTDLAPDRVRIWDAFGVIAVATTEEKSAIIVIRCMPRSK